MKSLLHRVILLLVGLLFLTSIYATLNTIAPLWLSRDGVSTWLIGVVGTSFFVGNLAGTLASGFVIDRIGYKGAYMAACLLCVLSTIGLIPAESPLGWMGVRFVAGVSCAMVWVIVESALLRLGNSGNRGGLLASYMAVYYLATVIGQFLVTVLPDDRIISLAWMTGIGMMAVFPILFMTFSPPEAPRPFPVIWAMILWKRTRLSALGCVISGIILGTIYSLMPLFLSHQGMSKEAVGYWMALLVAAGILGQWPLGRLADVKGRHFVLRLQSWTIIASCVLLATGYTLPVALFVLGCAGFSLYPVTLALGCDRLPKDYLVPMNQALLLSFTLGTLAGPMTTSWLMDNFSDLMMPIAMAFTAAIYLSILITHARLTRRRAQMPR